MFQRNGKHISHTYNQVLKNLLLNLFMKFNVNQSHKFNGKFKTKMCKKKREKSFYIISQYFKWLSS
jgi:hypothetical protein